MSSFHSFINSLSIFSLFHYFLISLVKVFVNISFCVFYRNEAYSEGSDFYLMTHRLEENSDQSLFISYLNLFLEIKNTSISATTVDILINSSIFQGNIERENSQALKISNSNVLTIFFSHFFGI